MRIAWISHAAELAGAERCLAEAIISLRGKVSEQYLVVPADGGLARLVQNCADSISIIPHPWWIKECRGTRNPLIRFYQYASAIIRLVRFLKTVKPELAITNSIVTPCGAIAAKIARVPHVWYIHEYLEEDHGFTFEFGRKFSLFLLEKLSRQIITNSQGVFDKYRKAIPAEKIDVVYYSVNNPPQFGDFDLVPPTNGYFHLVLVGRQSRAKGQEDAIRALAIVRERGVNAYLWLVGSGGDYTSYLVRLVTENGLSDYVRFIPFVSNPLTYMFSADAVLMCSRSEAFGRVLIEGMKQAKAVIAANSGSTLELIKDGWNGLVYEPGSAESLACKIEQLSRNHELKESLGQNALRWANENFNEDKYALDLIEVFSRSQTAT